MESFVLLSNKSTSEMRSVVIALRDFPETPLIQLLAAQSPKLSSMGWWGALSFDLSNTALNSNFTKVNSVIISQLSDSAEARSKTIRRNISAQLDEIISSALPNTLLTFNLTVRTGKDSKFNFIVEMRNTREAPELPDVKVRFNIKDFSYLREFLIDLYQLTAEMMLNPNETQEIREWLPSIFNPQLEPS